MKTVLVPVTTNFFARNFLQNDALPTLLKGGARLIFLVPKEKLDYYRQKFGQPNVEFEVLPKVGDNVIEKIFKFLEIESIHTQHVTMRHYRYLTRKGNKKLSWLNFLRRTVIFCLSRLCWNLGQFYFWRNLIRRLYYRIPSSTLAEMFNRYKPDLMFCPSTHYSVNIFLREAKKKGIKTVGVVASWDNIYTKSFFRVFPDQLVVYNKLTADQSARYGDYERDKISIVGVPQYDYYFRGINIKSREEFYRQIGADPAKKLILYAFSGKDGLAADLDMLDIIYKAIKAKRINGEVEVFVRLYPQLNFSELYLKNLCKKYGFLGQQAASYVGGGRNKWEFDDESVNFLTNSLAHADLIINMHSTFFIEGAIFDKPLIGVAFDGYQRLNYWNSVRRCFDWNHLVDIKEFNGIWIVRNEEELIEAINGYIKNPAYLAEGRKKIVAQQCEFSDGYSGKRLAEVILNSIK